eukprot:m.132299 g.132299  ORF g.132299 m.132299 type:complete len:91 (+) comp17493_c0_seq1:133-405(+)
MESSLAKMHLSSPVLQGVDEDLKNHPVSSQTNTVEVDDVSTNFIVSKYSNYYFVIISQYSRIGTLLHISEDQRGDQEAIPTYRFFDSAVT